MTGSTIAYELRADHEADGPEPFTGGLITLGAGRDLNVAEALEPDGRIVIAVDDHTAAIALDAYTPLKRVAVSDADELTVTRWDAVTYAELQAEARRRELAAAGKRDDLVARLTANDAAIATGNIGAQPAPADDPPVEPNPAADPPAPNPAANDEAAANAPHPGELAGDQGNAPDTDTTPEA